MKTTSRRLFASVAILLSVTSIAAAQRMFADVTGKWAVTSNSPNGPLESTAVFKQEDTALSGTIDVPQMGGAKLSGTVKGDTVQYKFTLDAAGNLLDINVTGVLKDKDNMSGTIYLPGDLGNYPFTAKRVPQ